MKYALAVLVLSMSIAVPHSLSAATLYVANNGVDSATCGAQSDPCRSIGRAIEHASAGDTIVVGPGRYGWLSDNGDLPGDEPGGSACGAVGVICIDKPLTIESSHGAQVTVYLFPDSNVIDIRASNVTFGRPGKGFNVTGAMHCCSALIRFADGTTGSTVSGNLLTDASIEVNGNDHTVQDNDLKGGESSSTIFVNGSGHVIRNNTISSGGSAFIVTGTGHALLNNVAISASPALKISASSTTVSGNSFLGSYTGVFITAAGVVLNGNNLLGNGTYASLSNCALVNSSGAVIDATNNFWGASTGPGLDPADAVCDDSGSSTTVTPFATQQFAIAAAGSGGGGNGAPVCTAAQAVPAILWPANGQFASIGIIGVGDPENDPVSLSITGVTQDEPTSGLVTGDIGPDATVSGTSVGLRAQRDTNGNGRVYRVQFGASDGNGGSCNGAVTVGVPNSQKPGLPIIDDGQNFSSTQ
jgi:hypothetical protein